MSWCHRLVERRVSLSPDGKKQVAFAVSLSGGTKDPGGLVETDLLSCTSLMETDGWI